MTATSLSRLPLTCSRSSFVSLSHCVLTSPFIRCHLFCNWSLFMARLLRDRCDDSLEEQSWCHLAIIDMARVTTKWARLVLLRTARTAHRGEAYIGSTNRFNLPFRVVPG